MSDLWPVFLSYVLPIAGSVLSALAAWGLTLLARKIGIEVDLTRDAVLRRDVRKFIGAAEEWAARKAKVEEKPSGAAKFQWVVEAVAEKWPNLLPDDLEVLIDQELASTAGVGATGDKAVQ